jgi:endonuclease YncB( thermonuclease family)
MAFAASLALPTAGNAGESIAGPVSATVVRVVDGDTLTVDATIWIGQHLTVNARIRGIDAPELHGACEREKTMAEAAKAKLAGIAEARPVRLINIENDKYGGRVLADIETAEGTNLATYMLATGLARAYDGGNRGGWCDVAGLGG